MLKKFLILILFSIVTNSYSQDRPWAIQANLNPFFLGAINSDQDANIKSDGLSGGFNSGISIKHYLSMPWSIEAGILYSNQEYNGLKSGSVPEGSDLKIALDYYKFPLLVNYEWSLNYTGDTKLSFGAGGQILQLIDYKSTREDRLQIITIEDGKRVLYIKDEDLIKSVFEEDFFSKTRLGLVGQFGIEKRLSDSFYYTLKLKTEYDLGLIDDHTNNYE